MTPFDIYAVRSRIERAFRAVRDPSGAGFQTSYQATGTDFTTNFCAVGMKAPEQLEDDFLNLFVWTWSLKDYLKLCFELNGLRGRVVEDEVNRCPALGYVSDIANRAKHGTLRESRSGQFAELVDVRFEAPQETIEQISFAGPHVTLNVRNPQLVQIHATVVTNTGTRLEALSVLSDSMFCWETRVLPRIAT